MAGTTQTSYTLTYGGVSGYINVGGWNTTLTAADSTAQEACGIKRWDGAHQYIYACRRTSSAQPGQFQIRATNTQDGQSVMPTITFTNHTVGGTACQWIVLAVAVSTVPSNTYAWYLQEGVIQVMNVTNTAVVTSGTLLCMSVASGSAMHQTAAWKNAQGWALSDIACNDIGPAYVKLTGL